MAGLLALVLLTFLGFAIFNDDPFGGEPIAKVTIPTTTPKSDAGKAASATTPAAAPSMVKPQSPADDQTTVTIIDGSSGARRDVTVPAKDPDGRPANSAPAVATGINPQLLESTRYGMIPTMAGGLKPSQV